VQGRRGIRREHLLDELKETIGYCQLQEDVLDRTLWGTGFGRGYGSLVRQTMNNTSFLFSIPCVETDVVVVTLPYL